VHNPTRQMEKQPNQLLWHGIFLLIVLAAIFGIYKAVQSVDYTWRWERIPPVHCLSGGTEKLRRI